MADSKIKLFDYPSWITNSKAWNSPVLDGEFLPGTVHLQETGVEIQREKNKASGKDSGSIIFRGIEAPEFMFELELNTLSDELAWEKLKRKLLSRIDPRNRTSYSVFHPILTICSINRCIVHKVTTTPPRPGRPMIGKIYCTAVSITKANATKNVTPRTLNAPDTIDIGPGVRAADPRNNKFNPAKNPTYK